MLRLMGFLDRLFVRGLLTGDEAGEVQDERGTVHQGMPVNGHSVEPTSTATIRTRVTSSPSPMAAYDIAPERSIRENHGTELAAPGERVNGYFQADDEMTLESRPYSHESSIGSNIPCSLSGSSVYSNNDHSSSESNDRIDNDHNGDGIIRRFYNGVINMLYMLRSWYVPRSWDDAGIAGDVVWYEDQKQQSDFVWYKSRKNPGTYFREGPTRRLSKNDMEVIGALFSHRDFYPTRRETSWDAFTLAMGHLGFKVTPCDGAKYELSVATLGALFPIESRGNKIKVHRPHGRKDKLGKVQMRGIGKKMTAAYGWTAETFIGE
ncbi:hypothetical protein F5X98DRAFT_385634 [Xylaria grammica]|nr:hypothetical protein F5X98DRAFT_385634 [Xylaria grammica]